MADEAGHGTAGSAIRGELWRELDRRRTVAYALAIGVTAVAALTRWFLSTVLAQAPYLAFYPAVVIAAALGGTGPGLLSTFASLLLVNYVFGVFDVHEGGAVIRQVIWIVANVGVSVLAGMQRAARLQRDRFASQHQMALDAAHLGWWHWDPVTLTASYDVRSAEILDSPGSQRSRDQLVALVDPADLPRLRAAWAAALDPADPRPFSTEFRVVRPDGSFRWVEANGVAAFEGKGPARRATSLVGTAADVTVRKHAEEALRRHELVVQQSRDVILFMRRDDGRILEANPAATSAYGYTREELLALSIRDLRGGDTRDLVTAQMSEAGTRGVLFESVHQRKDGSTFPVEVSSRGVVVDGTQTLVSVVRDITDRRRTEAALREANERLREADRRKDEFLGMLSHELRNPLAPIRNATYILRKAQPGGEQSRRAEEVIERQTAHLARLVDDLLDITRVARGKIELRRARVDLAEVVRRAADDFRLVMSERGVQFHVALDDERLWSDADAVRITQAIGNLLHNASKFSRKGGEITLSLERDGPDAAIRVRDTGEGIDPALLPRIFEPFVQGDRTLARTEGGLGLGLALVKGIAELHGGAVTARSAGKGSGAEFLIRLPLTDAVTAPLAPAPAARPSRGARSVLVVDDNHDAAESLAEVVKMLGHVVEVAYDGPSALEVARARRLHVVLCDIGLPGMSGYDVAKALRAMPGNDLRLIAVSGYAQPEDVNRALEVGFDGHLAKPCSAEEIERLLG